MPPTAVTVTDIDHLVLECADVETTLGWYQERLGLAPVRVDEWRAGTVPFPSVRVNEHIIIDLIAGHPTSGRLDHFCLVVAPTDLALADPDVSQPVGSFGKRAGRITKAPAQLNNQVGLKLKCGGN